MEGLITLVIAIVFTLLVPPKVGDGRALVGFGRWNYFTDRESHIIRNRVLLDDPRKARGQISISGSDIWKVLTQPRIMQHVLLTLVSMSGFQGLTQYTPSMIKSMGFTAVRANALSSVPVYCSIVWLTILSFAAYVVTEDLKSQPLMRFQRLYESPGAFRLARHYLERCLLCLLADHPV